MDQKSKTLFKSIFNITVLVSALGYFVDIYDLILFGIVRIPSLTYLGLRGNQLIDSGVFLLNMQMGGMLIGGLIFGILGDKKGRLSVLFGSIFLYSLANFLNAFVSSVEMYALLRFIAGVGLAGELGAAITLVSETMTKETRGYGTAMVATIGVSGAILAAIVGEEFSWQTAYIIGGILGIILLILRISVFESGMYKSIAKTDVAKGKFLKLFTSKDRFFRYLNCILIGLPIWFVVGILVTFSPEFAKTLGVKGEIVAGKSIMYTYTGLIFGDFISGFLSQILKSRKKVVSIFILLTAIFVMVYLFSQGFTTFQFYALCVILGISIGYWAVFITTAAEQFGTNLRSTVATTVPNFIRGSVIPITLSFELLRQSLGLIYAALIVGIIAIIIALISLYNLKDTYGVELDYVENI
ncbi:MAG TPA: MFS transporter [Ignavibacteriaceae bacterium]|jgi:MFS family permease|nr:MAG: putative niacin/nicotinamide transporter NaiP [Ignavibacteria bacterium ADurb.Bin266]HQI40068.1 MFS transporter [Ignavibacteriaceae bacterium]